MRIAVVTRVLVSLALSVSLTVEDQSYAQVPVNSTINAQNVPAGTYYNTLDGKTTFKNTGAGGLWVKAGTNLRGLEVDQTGKLTNHGGTFHFYAPSGVVRVDGTIDVSGVNPGSGYYLGNGGKVFIDSA